MLYYKENYQFYIVYIIIKFKLKSIIGICNKNMCRAKSVNEGPRNESEWKIEIKTILTVLQYTLIA